MAAGTISPVAVLRDAVLRTAPQDEADDEIDMSAIELGSGYLVTAPA
jgi:hypothetical protein